MPQPKRITPEDDVLPRHAQHLRTLALEIMGWHQIDPHDLEHPPEVTLQEHCQKALAGHAPIWFWVSPEAGVVVVGIAEHPVAWDPFEAIQDAWDLLQRVRAAWPFGKRVKFLKDISNRISQRLVKQSDAGKAELVSEEMITLSQEGARETGARLAVRWPFAMFYLLPSDIAWATMKLHRGIDESEGAR